MNFKINNVVGSVLVLLAFLISFYNQQILDYFGLSIVTAAGVARTWPELALRVGIYLVPVVIVSVMVLGVGQIARAVFKPGQFVIGLLLAAFFVSPMWLYGFYNYNAATLNLAMIDKVFVAAILEEILFRGFLFGLLFFKFGWGFAQAALYSSLMFGLGHTYQTNNSIDMLLIVALTGAIALWWCWLYVEWNKNLYLVIGLHALMNYSWLVFLPAQNVLGTVESNSLRLVTMVFASAVTIFYCRRVHGNEGFDPK